MVIAHVPSIGPRAMNTESKFFALTTQRFVPSPSFREPFSSVTTITARTSATAGTGALKQRVHGVVDVYGRRKPSYDLLRSESSPIESLTADNRGGAFHIALKTLRRCALLHISRIQIAWRILWTRHDSRRAARSRNPGSIPGSLGKICFEIAAAWLPNGRSI